MSSTKNTFFYQFIKLVHWVDSADLNLKSSLLVKYTHKFNVFFRIEKGNTFLLVHIIWIEIMRTMESLPDN